MPAPICLGFDSPLCFFLAGQHWLIHKMPVSGSIFRCHTSTEIGSFIKNRCVFSFSFWKRGGQMKELRLMGGGGHAASTAGSQMQSGTKIARGAESPNSFPIPKRKASTTHEVTFSATQAPPELRVRPHVSVRGTQAITGFSWFLPLLCADQENIQVQDHHPWASPSVAAVFLHGIPLFLFLENLLACLCVSS